MAKPRITMSADGKSVTRVTGSENFAYYDGASTVHEGLMDWNPGTYDADGSIDGVRDSLINRSHDAHKNNAIARAVVESRCTGVVATGLKVQSNINEEYLGISVDEAERIESLLEHDFDLWAKDDECDITRKLNFYESQLTLERDASLSGDCFSLLPYITSRRSPWGLKFQLVDGQRVSNPMEQPNRTSLAFGIEKDRFGAAKRVHIRQAHPGSLYLDKDQYKWEARDVFGRRTGRRNVIHYHVPERIGLTRGVPILAPVLALLKESGTYIDSEVRAAVVTSYFTAFLRKTSTTGGPSLPKTGETLSSGKKLAPNQVSMGRGSIVELPSWVSDIDFADPSRPNTNAPEFIFMMIQLMGAACGMPFEIVLKKFQSSYSASRAARLEAAVTFALGREHLANKFCQPIYEAFVDAGVASGRYKLPGYEDPYKRRIYLGTEWIGDSMGEIDELKAMQAAKLAKELDLKTMNRLTRELTGEPYRNVQRQLRKERRTANVDADGGKQPVVS